MSEKFRYKDKIIIMPDATAYRADDDKSLYKAGTEED